MVANEIAGSGQVDVFLGGGSRWTTSSTGITSVTCQASRLSGVTTTTGGGGGGVVGTASAPTTTPPGGDAVNLSQRYGPHSTADRHRTTAAAAQGWADTRQPSPDIGPSETDEKGLPPPQSPRRNSSSSVDDLDRVQQQQQKRSVGNSCLDSGSSSASGAVHYRVVSSSSGGSGLRINNNSSATVGGSTGGQSSSDGEDSVIEAEEQQQPSRKSINIIHAGVVNDALDAPQKSDDQQHDDKMPRQSHYDSGSVQHQQQQHAQWQTQGGGGGGDCDEINNTSLSSSSSSSGGGGGVPLKSALKRPTAGRCGGVAGTLQQLQSLRKKARVRFNEALNTFLECDYVIYVDDDEYDLLYHLDAVAAAAAAAAAAAQAEAELADPANVSPAASLVITTTEQPQLVNVRSFELQLPETSTCVSHGPVTGSAAPAVVASTGEAGTLSPPDGYKDAAAFYAAAAALVDLENHVHLSGFADDGVDPWESEDYDDEEGMADEAEALDNGWMDSQLSEESPKSHANRQQQQQLQQQQTPQQQQQQPVSDGPAVGDLVPLPDPPRTGILKGGKLWRGAVNNNNNSSSNNDSSQNNSSSTSSSAGASSAVGEEATLSRHGEKSPAVRFIHLNDAQCGGDSEDGASSATAANCNATGGPPSGGGGQSQRSGGGGGTGTGHHHNSAFQQLFPRARKLLQELPEAEIQRLTTAARANNAPSSVSSVSSFGSSSSSRTGVTSLLGHSTDSAITTDTTDASDLK